MTRILTALYDHFYIPHELDGLNQEASSCHRLLIETLSKDERKVLLKLIDAKDQITESQSIDSFICGFRLAWQLSAELNFYEESNQKVMENQYFLLSQCQTKNNNDEQ